jgi:hypothetical protein
MSYSLIYFIFLHSIDIEYSQLPPNYYSFTLVALSILKQMVFYFSSTNFMNARICKYFCFLFLVQPTA